MIRPQKKVSTQLHQEITRRIKQHEQGKSITYTLEQTKQLLKGHLRAIRSR